MQSGLITIKLQIGMQGHGGCVGVYLLRKSQVRLSIYFTKNNVLGSNDSNHISQHVIFRHHIQSL